MVKIKFGANIANMSGKIGGQVYSHNAAGAYLRNIGTIAVAPSAAMIASQNAFASLVAAWKVLPEVNQNAWKAAVVNFQKLNVFSDVYTMNGFQLFCSVNRSRLNINQVILLFPPMPVMPEQVQGFAVYDFFSSGGFAAVDASGIVDPSSTLIIEATPPIPTTVNNYKVLLTKITLLYGSSPMPVEIAPAYITKYGSPTPGMRGGFKCTPVHTASGTKGQSTYSNYLFP